MNIADYLDLEKEKTYTRTDGTLVHTVDLDALVRAVRIYIKENNMFECQMSIHPCKKHLDIETEDFGHQQFDSDKSRKFWLCWVEGKSAPVKKHLTFDDAMAEAARLSKLPGNEDVEVSVLGREGYCITFLPRNPITRYVEL